MIAKLRWNIRELQSTLLWNKKNLSPCIFVQIQQILHPLPMYSSTETKSLLKTQWLTMYCMTQAPYKNIEL